MKTDGEIRETIMLTKKFGTLNDVFKKKIKNMGSDNLNLLIANILDIESLDNYNSTKARRYWQYLWGLNSLIPF